MSLLDAVNGVGQVLFTFAISFAFATIGVTIYRFISWRMSGWYKVLTPSQYWCDHEPGEKIVKFDVFEISRCNKCGGGCVRHTVSGKISHAAIINTEEKSR